MNKLELDKETKQYKLPNQLTKYDLIILDEQGYLPFIQKRGGLLFHLISQLHEKVSINLAFSEWATLLLMKK